MMTFPHFQATVKAAGLSAVDRGNGHWQIIGGVKAVNVYPFSKTGTRIYVSGAVSSVRHDPLTLFGAAITAAKRGVLQINGRVQVERVNRLKSKKARYIRGELFAVSNRCRWCSREFQSVDESTLEHIIPLAQGGSNRRDNLTFSLRSVQRGAGRVGCETSIEHTRSRRRCRRMIWQSSLDFGRGRTHAIGCTPLAPQCYSCVTAQSLTCRQVSAESVIWRCAQ